MSSDGTVGITGSGAPGAPWDLSAGNPTLQEFPVTTANFDVGAGSLIGHYTRVGQIVDFEVRLQMGSGFSVAGNMVLESFPFDWWTIFSPLSFKGGVYDASSTSFSHPISGRYAGGAPNSFGLMNDATAGAGTGIVNATVPITWAVGDGLYIRGRYRTLDP